MEINLLFKQLLDYMVLVESSWSQRGIRKPTGIFNTQLHGESKKDRFEQFKNRTLYFLQDDEVLPFLKNVEAVWKTQDFSNFFPLEGQANELIPKKMRILKEHLKLGEDDLFTFTVSTLLFLPFFLFLTSERTLMSFPTTKCLLR